MNPINHVAESYIRIASYQSVAELFLEHVLGWTKIFNSAGIHEGLWKSNDEVIWGPAAIEDMFDSIRQQDRLEAIRRTVWYHNYGGYQPGRCQISVFDVTSMQNRIRELETKVEQEKSAHAATAVKFADATLELNKLRSNAPERFLGRTIQEWETEARHRAEELSRVNEVLREAGFSNTSHSRCAGTVQEALHKMAKEVVTQHQEVLRLKKLLETPTAIENSELVRKVEALEVNIRAKQSYIEQLTSRIANANAILNQIKSLSMEPS